MIPRDSPSCYDSAMRNLVVLFIHFIATLARLLGPGGVRSLVAESFLLKHQLLIVNRSRQRSPNLHSSGWYVFAVNGGTPRQLTDAEDAVVNEFRFGAQEGEEKR